MTDNNFLSSLFSRRVFIDVTASFQSGQGAARVSASQGLLQSVQ